MPYILKSGAVVMHTPKTGGTWVRRVLQQYDLLAGVLLCPAESWHATAFETMSVLDRGRVYVGFVRHPVSWLRSFFAYAEDHNWIGLAPILQPLYDCRAGTFTDFVDRYLTRCPGHVGVVFRASVGNCEWIGRYEQLRDDLRGLLAHAGHELTPGQIAEVEPENVSASMLRAGQPSPELVRRIEEAEASAIAEYYGGAGVIDAGGS